MSSKLLYMKHESIPFQPVLLLSEVIYEPILEVEESAEDSGIKPLTNIIAKQNTL